MKSQRLSQMNKAYPFNRKIVPLGTAFRWWMNPTLLMEVRVSTIHYAKNLPVLFHDLHLQVTMAKNVNYSVVKLVSAAKTGYEKFFKIRKNAQKLNLILYDPRAKRHCLFTEVKKRKIATPPERDFTGKHR